MGASLDHLMLMQLTEVSDESEERKFPLSMVTPTMSPTVNDKTKREEKHSMTEEQKESVKGIIGLKQKSNEGSDASEATQVFRSDRFKNDFKKEMLLRGKK